MGFKIKLVKSFVGRVRARSCATIAGLGLKKFGQERLLKDTPADPRHGVQGAATSSRHEMVKDEPKTRERRKPRKIRAA